MSVIADFEVLRRSTTEGSCIGADGNYHPTTIQVIELRPNNLTGNPDLIDARMVITGSIAAMITLGYMTDQQTHMFVPTEVQTIDVTALE